MGDFTLRVALTENWDMGMCDPEDPLFTPSWSFSAPPFQHFFSSQDPTFAPKSQIS